MLSQISEGVLPRVKTQRIIYSFYLQAVPEKKHRYQIFRLRTLSNIFDTSWQFWILKTDLYPFKYLWSLWTLLDTCRHLNPFGYFWSLCTVWEIQALLDTLGQFLSLLNLLSNFGTFEHFGPVWTPLNHFGHCGPNCPRNTRFFLKWDPF